MSLVIHNLAFDDSGSGLSTSNSCRIDISITGSDFKSTFGSVLGGKPFSHTLCSSYSTIIMGESNSVLPIDPMIGDYGMYNTIVNGFENKASGCYSQIFAGKNNSIESTSEFSTIFGGNFNVINNKYNSIAGGNYNVIGMLGRNSHIGIGEYNIIEGTNNQIHNGQNNTICGDNNSIFNGIQNEINTLGIGASSIFNGRLNCNLSINSTIGKGIENFNNGDFYNTIHSGMFNIIHCDTTGSIIASGCCNELSQMAFGTANYSNILSGSFNSNNGSTSAIAGGNNNRIFPNANNSIILGGSANVVDVDVLRSSIGGGQSNRVLLNENVIVGGNCNNNSGIYSFLGGGEANCIHHAVNSSAIVGGQNNNLFMGASVSVIGGGCSNKISYPTSTPPIAENNAILGGQLNSICTGTYNNILGGCNNTINGNFNSILGGSGNTINGFDYVGMFGCNVCAVRNEAFHANNYVIQNISASSGVSGQLYFEAGTCALLIT